MYSELRSHFTLGQPVSGDDFFGRREELSKIFSLLQVGSAVNFFSIRRMGKSSLLRQISYLCENDTNWECYHPVYLDAMAGGESLANYLLWRLDVRTNRHLKFDDAWREVERHLQRTTGKSLLLIDEVGYWLQERNRKRDLAPLRALHQAGILNIVASTVYGSIIEQLQHLSELASPFYNIFHVFRLPSFPPEEAEELLITLCDRGGVALEPDFARELARYVGYYPNIVQEIGHIAFEHLC